MAKLKALNQAAVNMPTGTAAASTSPFVSPLLTPVQKDQSVENTPAVSLSEVAATVDAVSDGLIHYLTGEVNDSVVVVDTNQSCEGLLDGEPVQPIEATVTIKPNGVCQPLKPIAEMLKELEPKKSSRKKDDHIKESNIIVSTPVFDQIISESRMKEKTTPKIKKKGMKEKGIGRGGGGAVPGGGGAPGGGAPRGHGRAPTLVVPVDVPY